MFNARREAQLLEAATREGNPDLYFDELAVAIEDKAFKPRDFHIADVFDHFIEGGREIRDSWSMRRQSGGQVGIALRESEVSTANFANIMGQIVYSAVMEVHDSPDYLADRLVETIPTEFDGEKIPGISDIGDEAESIPEGHPYPLAGVSEYWIETPTTIKRGLIVPVTKEAIFFDRTNLVLQRARAVARTIVINKEKRVLDTVLGIDDSYKRNASSAIPTYGENSGSHDWDNLSASTGLEDWTDVETAELLFDGLTDPDTGEPIMVTPDTLIVPTALKRTARRIVSALETREITNTNTTTLSGNPLAGDYSNESIATSAYVKSRTSSASTWFIGKPREAFAYMENWPITVAEAPTNSYDEFHKDIVHQSKVSERGAAAVMEPRKMVKCTA